MKVLEKNELNFVSGGICPVGMFLLGQSIGSATGAIAGSVVGLSSDEMQCFCSGGLTIPGWLMGGVFGFVSSFGFGMMALSLYTNHSPLEIALKTGVLGGVIGGLAAAQTKYDAYSFTN